MEEDCVLEGRMASQEMGKNCWQIEDSKGGGLYEGICLKKSDGGYTHM